MSDHSPVVLVVDDDELTREFVVDAVNQLGYGAVGPTSPESAVEVVEKTPSIRVLLSNITLRTGTGPDLVRQALRNRPDLKVVFMIGSHQDIAFRRTDPLLNKPFDLQRLRHVIENVLSPTDDAFHGTVPVIGDRRRLKAS